MHPLSKEAARALVDRLEQTQPTRDLTPEGVASASALLAEVAAAVEHSLQQMWRCAVHRALGSWLEALVTSPPHEDAQENLLYSTIDALQQICHRLQGDPRAAVANVAPQETAETAALERVRLEESLRSGLRLLLGWQRGHRGPTEVKLPHRQPRFEDLSL